MEAAIVSGEKVDVARYTAVINAQRRVLVTLGLKTRIQEAPRLRDVLSGSVS